MNFSAAASSSPVVTPGRAFARIIRWQRTRISPAAAIRSTCSGVLRMIIRYTLEATGGRLDRLVGFQFQRREGAAQLVGDGVRRLGAVDPAQQALVVVELDQRLGLLVVGLQPPPA